MGDVRRSRVDDTVAALTAALDGIEETLGFLNDIGIPAGLEERQGQTIVLANAMVEAKRRCWRMEDDCVRLLNVLHDRISHERRTRP